MNWDWNAVRDFMPLFREGLLVTLQALVLGSLISFTLGLVWALLMRRRAEVYPEDIQDLARYVLPHRVWLGPHAASHGLTSEAVIQDIIDRVPIP